jgi:sulfite oxidase
MYTRAEVAAHTSKAAGGVWVTVADGVYDITEFIDSHPGGADKIRLAAGGDVEPFWRTYTVHKSSSAVAEQLASMRVGSLAPEDAAAAARAAAAIAAAGGDPYAAEPPRHPALITHTAQPFNAETPEALIPDNFLTPNELWYVRHHHPVPVIDADEYRLKVTVQAAGGSARGDAGERTIELSLADLRRLFRTATVTATLQCAGNRRSELTEAGGKKCQGLGWSTG